MERELVPTQISPDILETFGRTFNFRHGGGVAEWLKNSLDNYLRLRELGKETRSGNWPVLISLIDSGGESTGPSLAVIDFGGTSRRDIEDFFLHWGSQSAATLGSRLDGASVTGGHGNGGKFYMRQMWRNGARFLTWRDGKSTSLVVERRTDGNTGYWEFKDEDITWREALQRALATSEHLGGADRLLDYLEASEPQLMRELDEHQRGLTAVVGRRASRILTSNDLSSGGRWNHQRIVDAIRDAPQARRPIRELAISVFKNGTLAIDRLSPEELLEDPNWPPQVFDVPNTLIVDARLRTEQPTVGTLRLMKAGKALTGRRRDRNAVFVLDKHGNPIASYSIREIPLPGHSPILTFMHAELTL
jgi:hypothetical protein